MEQLPLDSMEKEKNIPMEEDPVLISADQQIETDENNLAKIEIVQENLSNDEEELNEGRVCERMSYEGFKIFDICRYIPHKYCQNWKKAGIFKQKCEKFRWYFGPKDNIKRTF